jgi:hypothetical protein
MLRLQRSILVLFLTLTATRAIAVDTEYQGGNTTLNGSEFHYTIGTQQQERFIAVEHLKKRYEGPLAELSFRDRHLQILRMVFLLIRDSCSNGVSAMSKIRLSRDLEQDEDPGANHPQYVIVTYSCK